MPARGQLFLVEVNDFHLGLLPNELAGVHEGAVPRASQAICCADLFAAVFAEIDAVIIRKEKAVAQFGHATGELRYKLARF